MEKRTIQHTLSIPLYIPDSNLHRTISYVLGNFSLVELDLSINQPEATIRTSLGNLCNLREIDFSYLKLNKQINDILEILAPCTSRGLNTFIHIFCYHFLNKLLLLLLFFNHFIFFIYFDT